MPPERKREEDANPEGGCEARWTKSPRPSPNLVDISRESGLVWRGPEYPTLEPGRYTVRGLKIQGPQWVRSYMRWSLRVEFALVSEPGVVSAFFNFGDDPSAPRVRRRSRYYKAWVLANGEHPRKGQLMTPEIFLEGQFLEVVVDSCNRDEEGKPKAAAEFYSRVTQILSSAWP